MLYYDFAEYVIYFLIFAAILLPAEVLVLYLVWRFRYRERVSRRISVDGAIKDDEDPADYLRRVSPFAAYDGPIKPLRWLSQLLVQSGAALRLPTLLALIGTIAVVVLLLTRIFSFPWVLAVLVSGIGGGVLPLFALIILRNRRVRQIDTQLPDAIDVLVRSIKAGHPIAVAIAAVGREMPEPIGTEFRIAADEQTYGLDLEAAMMNMRQRINHGDLSLIVVAISIQSKSGGNLTEVLSNLSNIIRNRHRLRNKVKAFSAEGRASGIALSIMPVGLFGILWVIAPNFYGDVWDVSYVKPILVSSLAWMLFGIFVIFRMVNFKI